MLETLVATGNALFAGRAVDLRDIERQVLRKLAGDAVVEPELLPNAGVRRNLVRFHRAARQGGGDRHRHKAGDSHRHSRPCAGDPTLVAVGTALAEATD